MASNSMLLGSFPVASSVTPVGSCWKSAKCAKSYHASSYVTKASLYKTEKIQNEYAMVRHNLKHHYTGNEATSKCGECSRSYVVNAAPIESFESEPQDLSPKTFWGSIKYFLDTLYTFSRPYVMISTVISIISVSLLAVEKSSDISPRFFIGIFQAIIAALSMTLYVCGVNQLWDLEIDKINKPYLPLASGEFSFKIGVIITASCLILSFGLGWFVGSPPLLWALFVHFMLGSAYSIDLPLLRWKRSTVLTSVFIVGVRGITFQVGYFLHMQTHVLKRPTTFPISLIFATAFMTCFAIVIALSKDIPDMEGDAKFGLRSLAVRLGPKRVFWICVFLLEMAYGVAIVVGATSSYLWTKLVMGLGHAILASVLWHHAKSVDVKSRADTSSFYMFVWKLFYAEYFIIPLIR